MLTRDWILETLALLPVRTWPVFLWEVWWVERYYRAYRAANPVGMLGVGVTRGGRIIITLQMAGEAEKPADGQADWRALAPGEPWLRLAPAAGFELSGQGTEIDCFCTACAPLLDRSCTGGELARPLAPP